MTGDTTFEDARDLILTRFKEQLDEDYAEATASADDPTVYWDNLDSKVTPPQDAPWFRVNVKHADGGQSSMGEAGGRLFSRTGVVAVQVFVPAGARGLTLADRLGKIAVDAFEGKRAGEVWFRGVKLNEVGPDGPWFQYNVTADFTYDQTK